MSRRIDGAFKKVIETLFGTKEQWDKLGKGFKVLKEDFRKNPLILLWYFGITFGITIAIVGIMYYVQNGMQYCQFGWRSPDMPMYLNQEEVNKIPKIEQNMSLSYYYKNMDAKLLGKIALNCTMNTKRFWKEEGLKWSEKIDKLNWRDLE